MIFMLIQEIGTIRYNNENEFQWWVMWVEIKKSICIFIIKMIFKGHYTKYEGKEGRKERKEEKKGGKEGRKERKGRKKEWNKEMKGRRKEMKERVRRNKTDDKIGHK